MRRLMIGTALLALAACNRGGETNGGSGSGGTPAETPPQMTITTPEGKAEIRTGGDAGGLPAGIPAYPGADTSGGIQISGASTQGRGALQGFRTSDTPAQVIDFYASAAERAGFRIANRMTLGATTAALTAQREGETINVTATGADGATQVQIIVANDG